MSKKLKRIRDSLLKCESNNVASFINNVASVIMIRFLSNNLKFIMSSSSKNFILKTLSSKILQRSNIMLRSVNEISCDVLTNSTISKHEKEKILRDKSDDLVLLTSDTTSRVHIYDEIDELIIRFNIL